jgi:hypothetical protein
MTSSILSSLVVILAIPFAAVSILLHNRPILQYPFLWVASDLYTRSLLILTSEQRARKAQGIREAAIKSRQKGSEVTAVLLDDLARITSMSVAA